MSAGNASTSGAKRSASDAGESAFDAPVGKRIRADEADWCKRVLAVRKVDEDANDADATTAKALIREAYDNNYCEVSMIHETVAKSGIAPAVVMQWFEIVRRLAEQSDRLSNLTLVQYITKGLPMWSASSGPSPVVVSNSARYHKSEAFTNVQEMDCVLTLYEVCDLEKMHVEGSCKLWAGDSSIPKPSSEASLSASVCNLLHDIVTLFGLTTKDVVIATEIQLVRHRPDVLFLRTADHRVVGCVQLKRPESHEGTLLIEAPATADQYARYLYWLLAIGVRNPFVLVTDFEHGYVVALNDLSTLTPPTVERIKSVCSPPRSDDSASASAEPTGTGDRRQSPLKLPISFDTPNFSLGKPVSIRAQVAADMTPSENLAVDELRSGKKRFSEMTLSTFKSQMWDVRADPIGAFRLAVTAVAHMLVSELRTVSTWFEGKIPLILRAYAKTQVTFVAGDSLLPDVASNSSDTSGAERHVTVRTNVFEAVDAPGEEDLFYVLHELGRGRSGICAAVLVRDAAECVLRALKVFDKNDEKTKDRAAKEVENWNLYDGKFCVHAVTAYEMPAVLMPLFVRVTEEEKKEDATLVKIRAVLQSFHDRGYQHRDAGWHNVAKYKEGKEEDAEEEWQFVVLDLERLCRRGEKHWEENANVWIDKWMKTLH